MALAGEIHGVVHSFQFIHYPVTCSALLRCVPYALGAQAPFWPEGELPQRAIVETKTMKRAISALKKILAKFSDTVAAQSTKKIFLRGIIYMPPVAK